MNESKFHYTYILQLEVNPLAETPEGKIYTADAKLGFDDNAQYRQKDIFDMEDTTESDPREVEAGKFNLNYVQVPIICIDFK